jgi:acetolactate synthase-1/2/3 large subunit
VVNGARGLLHTLVGSGVEVCFANPGTSEMHFVAGLDDVDGMRAVLTLFEGVATGAADGYGRMTGTPAAVLLHLGPGLGNGLANLHNARRARTPVVAVVGDHARAHRRFDAPLASDIEAVAGTVSGWVRTAAMPETVAADAADAVAAARRPPGQVATLILPADVSWSEGAGVASPVPVRPPSPVSDDAVSAAAAALRSGQPTVVLIGGDAAQAAGVSAAGRVGAASGAKVICETFPRRLERGGGLPPIGRLAYLGEMASAQLAGARHLILAGARSPVSFFAYPELPSDLVPDGCTVHVLAEPGDDAAGALLRLADRLGAPPAATAPSGRPDRPTGPLTAEAVSAAVGALLPEGAIVVDESNTSGGGLGPATGGGPRHDWLTLTGGAIGFGLPVAAGAAVACPDRPVLCLESDGSAMYTLAALWTHAREQLDVTTVVYANRSYAILNMELARVGAGAAGPKAAGLLDLSSPELDFVSLARGMGVPAEAPKTAEEFTGALARALAEPGPHLIQVDLGR